MANIALFRYEGPCQLDVLFSGSEIERLSGLNKNVRNYYDMVADEKTRKALNAYHTIIINQPCGAYVADMVSTPSNISYVFETMQFPLSDDTGKVCFLLVYGYGRRPAHTDVERDEADRKLGHIRDMHFVDLGAGAPSDCIVDYQYKKG
ncbi:hypothetical protein [Kordiimonas aquimaris]|uniref:hypothetical protein n=1 Tax=Kordiimonas aquimaris TaxID=707591 RepID=UPI0021D167F6|nr:hypothetical protein [Kordiimonas aquimaris]